MPGSLRFCYFGCKRSVAERPEAHARRWSRSALIEAEPVTTTNPSDAAGLSDDSRRAIPKIENLGRLTESARLGCAQ
jgi:hypothetical protein